MASRRGISSTGSLATTRTPPGLRIIPGPSDAVGVDLSIGDPGKLSQGIGSAALREFTERLVKQGYRTIIIDPDPDNRRAVRAYESAGFRAIPQLLGRTGDTLIMQYELKENDPAS